MAGWDPELDALARRLRMARAAMGVTLREAGEGASVNPTVLSLWERGRRDPGVLALARLAVYYGVTLDWLMGIPRG